MATERMPTTDEVRDRWGKQPHLQEEFDRWLAAHDENLVNIICLMFNSDSDYTGDVVIGRIRAAVHAQEPHFPGEKCLVCDNDPAGEL